MEQRKLVHVSSVCAARENGWYYPCTGVDVGGDVRRHTVRTHRRCVLPRGLPCPGIAINNPLQVVLGTAGSLYVSSICGTSVQLHEEGLVDRYLVHRHILRGGIRMYLGTRVLPLRSAERGARAGALAPAKRYAPTYMPLTLYFTLTPGTA